MSRRQNRWRAVSVSLAEKSKKWRSISDQGRVLWLQLQLTTDVYGCMQGDAHVVWLYCTKRLGWTLSVTKRALDELADVQLVQVYVSEAGDDWVSLVDFDEHQPAEFLRKRAARTSPVPPPLGPPRLVGRPTVRLQKGEGRREKGERSTSNEVLSDETPDRDDVRTVFDHWVTTDTATGGGTDRRVLTDKRRGHIKARLADGFTVEQLCAVVTAFCADPWHLGRNDRRTRYTGIQTLLKNAEKVEAGLQLSKRHAAERERRNGQQATSLVRPAARAVEAVR